MAKRNDYIRLTLSGSEKAAIETAASIRGIPAAEWVRSDMVNKAWAIIDAQDAKDRGETE